MFLPLLVSAEEIVVKYRTEAVDTRKGSFEEFSLKSSSFIQRILYDSEKEYLLVRLNSVFYHYCSIPEDKVTSWVGAGSLGKFYHREIKGKFDCRIFPVPDTDLLVRA